MCSRAYHSHWKKEQAKKWMKKRFAHLWNHPPVNVKEYSDRYELLLYASGYEKSDFHVSLKNNTLVITVNKTSLEQEGDDWTWRRQEFKADAFERHFELSEKVDKEAISAKYHDGVLTVSIPLLEGFESVKQDIDIS